LAPPQVVGAIVTVLADLESIVEVTTVTVTVEESTSVEVDVPVLMRAPGSVLRHVST
jgi:hypothetical protein